MATTGKAAVFFGKGHGADAQLRQALPNLPAPALLLPQGVQPRIEIITVRHETVDALGQQPLLVSELEIH